MIRNSIIGIFFLGLLFLIFYSKSRDYLLQHSYDALNENDRITTKAEIDELLAGLDKLKYKELEEDYLNQTKSKERKFKNLLSGATYYKVNRAQINQKIVGNFRIKDFLSKDEFYYKGLYDKDYYQNWLIDKRLLYSILELQKELQKKGYNQDGFWIRYGHRTPKHNAAVNGAGSSRHILGEAADLVIEDINQDGKYTEEDKEIVLELVNNKIIGNKGGVGRYPGTRTIHIDVRGKRARWDSY